MLHNFLNPVKVLSLTILLSLTLLRFVLAGAQSDLFWVWVQDNNLNDSQFGYHNGTDGITQPEYTDYDLEGMACMDGTIYVSSGGDGDVPSRLFTVEIDDINNTSSLTEIGKIISGTMPLHEAVALASLEEKLFVYIDYEGERGIYTVDPESGYADLYLSTTQKVEGMDFISDTLYLAGNDHLYKLEEDSLIHLFDVDNVDQIEAMQSLDGMLYIGVNGEENIKVLDPTTGKIVNEVAIQAPNDIEALTYCELIPPTPTETLIFTKTPTPIETPSPTIVPDDQTPTPTEIIIIETMTSTPVIICCLSTPVTFTPVPDSPTSTPTPIVIIITPTPQPTIPTGETPTGEPGKPGNLFLPLISK